MQLRHAAPRFFRRVKFTGPLADLYYPEMFSEFAVLFAPRVVYWAWSVLKLGMSKELQSTVHIYAHGESRTKLVELVPAENTPACYGGACKALPPDAFERLGFDALDAATLADVWPGDAEHLGGWAAAGRAAVN